MTLELLADPVPNVRFAAAALLPALKQMLRLPEDVELLVGRVPVAGEWAGGEWWDRQGWKRCSACRMLSYVVAVSPPLQNSAASIPALQPMAAPPTAAHASHSFAGGAQRCDDQPDDRHRP